MKGATHGRTMWLYRILWSIAALALHQHARYSLFSVIPLTILVPLTIAWTVHKPFLPLLVWSIIAEIFSTLPLGVITVVQFIPWIIRRLFGADEFDLSLVPVGLIILSVTIQTAAIIGFDLVRAQGGLGWNWSVVADFMPWTLVPMIIIFSSLATILSCLVWNYFHTPALDR